MNPFKYLVLIMILFFATPTLAQTKSRDEVEDKIKSLQDELIRLELLLLSPAPDDFIAHKEFLNQPDTGLIRLLPGEILNGAKILTINGGGAFYSFKRKSQEYGYGSDIGVSRTLERVGRILKQPIEDSSRAGGTSDAGSNIVPDIFKIDLFSVGFAGADFGYLAMIDGDINDLTIDYPEIKFIASLKVPNNLPDARLEQKRSQEGVLVNGINYRRSQKAETEKTYILRSINYRSSDLLVCFRTVRRDKDGSWILLWKILKEFDRPILE